MHAIRRQHALGDLCIERATDLTDNFTDPESKLAAQNLMTTLDCPDIVMSAGIDTLRNRAVDLGSALTKEEMAKPLVSSFVGAELST